MYKKTKYMIYFSVAALLFLVAIAFVTLLNNNNNKGLQNKFNQDNQSDASINENYTTNFPQNYENYKSKIPPAGIRVSEDTRDFIYSGVDPLKSVSSNIPEFDVVSEPSNVKTTESQASINNNLPDDASLKDLEPLKSGKKTDNSSNSVSGYDLSLVSGNTAEEYEIAAKFNINSTEFFIIAHKPASIQRNDDFINRKFYIFKNKNGTLIRCFDLFEREVRNKVDVRTLFTVSVKDDDTIIEYHGPSNVMRRVYNAQLLAPYGENKNMQLLLHKSVIKPN